MAAAIVTLAVAVISDVQTPSEKNEKRTGWEVEMCGFVRGTVWFVKMGDVRKGVRFVSGFVRLLGLRVGGTAETRRRREEEKPHAKVQRMRP